MESAGSFALSRATTGSSCWPTFVYCLKHSLSTGYERFSGSLPLNAVAFTHRCGLWDPSLTARERRDHELINGSPPQAHRPRLWHHRPGGQQPPPPVPQMQKMFKSMGSGGGLVGLCERCETRAMEGKRHCWFHVAQIDEARRKRTGHKPWQPGSRGRPPLRG
jgi:hypothetical protein